MTTTTAPEKDHVSWEDLDRLTERMAERLAGERFDVLLAIARGGLVPAGMLAYRLGIREILVAAVTAYDDDGAMAETPPPFALARRLSRRWPCSSSTRMPMMPTNARPSPRPCAPPGATASRRPSC